jgi:hypothetical protein
MISKYQFMEVNTTRRSQGLREKIPDIQKTLETVRYLGGRWKVLAHPHVTKSKAALFYLLETNVEGFYGLGWYLGAIKNDL